MDTTSTPPWQRAAAKGGSAALILSLLFGGAGTALALGGSFDSALLVNTEAFVAIDSGDGASNIELRFGSSEQLTWNVTTGVFEFSDDLTVNGVLAVTGNVTTSGSLVAESDISTNANLTLNSDQTAANAVLTFGQPGTDETITFNNAAGEFQFSDDANFTGGVTAGSFFTAGNSQVQGALAVTGAIRTDSNLTINDDQTAADAVLTFGQPGTNETITFSNASGRFDLSDDLRVQGNMSGSTLTVDGAVTLTGRTYNFSNAAAASNTFLRNDGSGNLTWQSLSINGGSGNIVGLSPEYAGVVYFGSGSARTGTLANVYDTTNRINHYRWTTTRGTIQDYWMSVRVRVPSNFQAWDPVQPIQFQYRTGNASNAVNHVTVKMLDTAGSNVALTGAAALANTSLTTATITGPESAGTYTAGSYITLLIKTASTSAGSADAGFITLKWKTTTP
jgi:cytoskeletal protein CcmA (bactofilin family)